MSKSQSRWRQAPAIVFSLVALFASLAGAANALPGTETVNSGDIKNEAVKSVDLKDNKAVASADVIDESLGSTDIADQSIQGADIANDTVDSSDLAPNSVRSQELGDGIHGHTNTVSVPGGTAQNANYNFRQVTASCAAGEELISGSGHWTGDALGEELMLSEVILDHNNETVTVKGGNDFGVDRTLVAVASCL